MRSAVNVEIGRYGHFPVLYLGGDFDDQHHSDLIDAVAELEALGDRLIISLLDASYMDSTAVGIVIGTHRRVGNRGGVLAVTVGDSAVKRLFDVLEVHKELRLFASLEESRDFLVSSMVSLPLA